jgi:hypothetical protein
MVDCDLRLDSHLFCRGFMFYLCYLYSSTYTGVQHDFYIRCGSCRLSVTQRLSHVVQELLTLPEHTSSLPDCNGVRVARSFVFCVMFCISLVCPLFLFIVCRITSSDYPFGIFRILTIALSVLRFTVSDYPFGIFEVLAIVLSVLPFTVSDSTFGIFKHLVIALSVNLRFLINRLVSPNFSHRLTTLVFLW